MKTIQHARYKCYFKKVCATNQLYETLLTLLGKVGNNYRSRLLDCPWTSCLTTISINSKSELNQRCVWP